MLEAEDTEDTELNEYGQKLLLLLEIVGMVILNGTARAKSSWKRTFRKGMGSKQHDRLLLQHARGC